jgi:hypothetical protein
VLVAILSGKFDASVKVARTTSGLGRVTDEAVRRWPSLV